VTSTRTAPTRRSASSSTCWRGSETSSSQGSTSGRSGASRGVREHRVDRGAVASAHDGVECGRLGQQQRDDGVGRRGVRLTGLSLAPTGEPLLRPATGGGAALHVPTGHLRGDDAHARAVARHLGDRRTPAADEEHTHPARTLHVLEQGSGQRRVRHGEARGGPVGGAHLVGRRPLERTVRRLEAGQPAGEPGGGHLGTPRGGRGRVGHRVRR
jgi:hypothetical protein